jgi:hypothetical protein
LLGKHVRMRNRKRSRKVALNATLIITVISHLFSDVFEDEIVCFGWCFTLEMKTADLVPIRNCSEFNTVNRDLMKIAVNMQALHAERRLLNELAKTTAALLVLL